MKRQIGVGALAGLALAALLLAGCDTASNSGANEDEGGTQVTPPSGKRGSGWLWLCGSGKAEYPDMGI